MTTLTDRIAGLNQGIAIKAPVAAVASSNLTLSGLQTVGGVVLTDGDRVLVTAQTDTVQNGIYNARTGAWERAKDMNGANDVVSGTLVPIETSSTTVAFYRITTANPITIGTTGLSFTLITAAGDTPKKLHALTVAALKTLTPADGEIIETSGYTTAGDGGRATYRYDASSTATADDGSVIAPDSGTGRFLLQDAVPNLRQFGAAGDGTTDDTSAIDAASAWLAVGGDRALKLTDGTYRYTGTTNLGAFVFDDADGASLIFDGAELLLDNIVSNLATTDGIHIKNDSTNIFIKDPRIRWSSLPSTRNTRSGIWVRGEPANASKQCEGIYLLGTTVVENSGGTGVIVAGCRDVHIGKVVVKESQADGVHINACQDVTIGSVYGYNCGDDTLALVTYYHATEVYLGGVDGDRIPFNRASVGDWSNARTTVGEVHSYSSTADAIQIFGSTRCQIGQVFSDSDTTGGVRMDAGKIGGGFSFQGEASTLIDIGRILAYNTTEAFVAQTFNITASDTTFTTFDVHVGEVIGRGMTQRGVDILGDDVGEGCDGFSFGKIDVDEDIRFQDASDIEAKHVRIRDQDQDGGTGMHILNVCNNIRMGELVIEGGDLDVEGNSTTEHVSRLTIDTVRIKDSVGRAAYFEDADDINIGQLIIENMNTANSATADNMRALCFTRCQNAYVGSYILDQTQANCRLLEVGGGSADTDVGRGGDNIVVNNIVARLAGSTAHNITVQSGANGPDQLSYSGRWEDSSGAWFDLVGETHESEVETATGTYTDSINTRATIIDSSGGAVTVTLGSGTKYGQLKTFIMTDASNSSTVNVTNHETTSPEVFTFSSVNDNVTFEWMGTFWKTLELSGATV